MSIVRVAVTSASPLLMHNGQLADPTNPHVRALKTFTSKKKKTDEDLVAIKKLEFVGSLYWDSKLGPFIPSEMIEASIRNGAKVNKLGQQVLSSMICATDKAPLLYTGPREPDAMFANDAFVDTRGVRVGPSRVMRTRPRFNEWSLEFVLNFDPTGLSRDDLVQALHESGKKGFGDFRPKYGRFSVDSVTDID